MVSLGFSFPKERSEFTKIFKRLMRVLFSHIGLLMLNFAYCVGGAYLFAIVENDYVTGKIRDSVNASYRMEYEKWNYFDQLRAQLCSSTETSRANAEKLFDEYHQNVVLAVQNYGYTGIVINETDIKSGWIFPSALLFSLSIVTTIGYGHVTPKTAVGQMMVIIYALLGIPLMIMFLANVGDAMANFFRLAYSRGCCYVCWRRRKNNYESDKTKINQKNVFERRRSIATTTTPEPEHFKSSSAEAVKRRPSANDQSSVSVPDNKSRQMVLIDPEPIERRVSITDSEKVGDAAVLEEPDEEFLNVPISLTIVIIVTYLFIGAVLFAAWNGWSYVSGAYFSFVTLSTIGFGDLIPGLDEAGTPIGNIKLVISCLYIVFGLAVLTMCFNLMVDEMISKFKWFGRKLGILGDRGVNNISGNELSTHDPEQSVPSFKSLPANSEEYGDAATAGNSAPDAAPVAHADADGN